MNKIFFCSRAFFITVALLIFSTSHASTFAIPSIGQALIGEMSYINSHGGETLVNIAKNFDIGYNEIADANPSISPMAPLPSGVLIRLPTSFLLPSLPHKGIIINLSEMRMYYFPTDDLVKTYPIGIGRVGKTIPIVKTKVIKKAKNPIWIPPADIRAFNEEQGIKLPRIMPAGPDNPLGPFAIYLRIPSYLIHSTIFPESVGRRASFGCIRMHPNDIEDFFPLVSKGTVVTIVDMPTKVGWIGNSLYLETHEPLEEHNEEFYATNEGIIDAITKAISKHRAFVDWQLVDDLAKNRDGMPHEIGFKTD